MKTKKQTVVIFEGCDKVGKTEMAKELARRTEIPYFKNVSEWNAFSNDPSYFASALKYGDTYFYNFLKNTLTSTILDRSYPSEWVYSKVYNRKTDEATLKYIDDLASSFDVRIVIPYRSSYKGLKDDLHDIDEDHLQTLSDAYAKFANWTKCKVLRMCVDDEDLNRELQDILEFLGEK